MVAGAVVAGAGATVASAVTTAAAVAVTAMLRPAAVVSGPPVETLYRDQRGGWTPSSRADFARGPSC